MSRSVTQVVQKVNYEGCILINYYLIIHEIETRFLCIHAALFKLNSELLAKRVRVVLGVTRQITFFQELTVCKSHTSCPIFTS